MKLSNVEPVREGFKVHGSAFREPVSAQPSSSSKAPTFEVNSVTIPPEILDLADGDVHRVEKTGPDEYLIHNNHHWRRHRRS